MKKQKIISALAGVGLVVLFSTGCAPKPEKALASYVDNITKILEKNEKDPADGLEKLHKYLRKNLPDMMEQVGVAIVELDKIEDSDDRKDRLEEMQDVLEDSMKDLEKAAEKFAEEAYDDKDAMEYLEEQGKTWIDMVEDMEELEDLMYMF